MSRALRCKKVLDKTGLSKSTMYEMIKSGEFPKPIRLTERSSAWLEHEVDEWLDSRIKDSRSKGA